MSLQFQFHATPVDASLIADAMLKRFGAVAVTDEVSSERDVRWRTLDHAALTQLLVGRRVETGRELSFLARMQDTTGAARHAKMSHGYPLDRSSIPLVEVTPSGMRDRDTVRRGRLFLYEGGDAAVRTQFVSLQRSLRAASTSVPESMGARIFPHAQATALFLGGVFATDRAPNPFRT